jgi:hypothetical protein
MNSNDRPEVGQVWRGRISQDVELTIVKVSPKTDTVEAIVKFDGSQLSYVLSTFNEYYYLQPVRYLHQIAIEIKRLWKPVWFGAVPYLEAMGTLDSINEDYYADSALSVVLYFLGNAATWKGSDAKRIKAELKYICKQAR